jgi:tRNA U34 5-carboxymethylaminomethyl modifying enzyme MnmG/GidA
MATIRLEAVPNSAIIAIKYDVYVDAQKMNVEKSQKIKELTIAACTPFR